MGQLPFPDRESIVFLLPSQRILKLGLLQEKVAQSEALGRQPWGPVIPFGFTSAGTLGRIQQAVLVPVEGVSEGADLVDRP